MVEAANQPVVARANKVLDDNNIIVVSDILTNAGGVLGSYFEWTQNIQEFRWPISRFRDELDARMQIAFENVMHSKREHSCSLREGAYVVALRRVVDSFVLRGQIA